MLRTLLPLLILAPPASAEPMAPGAIEAIDGDTIRAHGVVFQLHERRRVFVHPRCAISGKLATKLRRSRSGVLLTAPLSSDFDSNGARNEREETNAAGVLKGECQRLLRSPTRWQQKRGNSRITRRQSHGHEI
jgi:hypothetical protein